MEGLLQSVPAAVDGGHFEFAGLANARGRGVAIAPQCPVAAGGHAGHLARAMVLAESFTFAVAFVWPLVRWASCWRAATGPERWMRPFLDAMQTTPAFVYLVPVVMLFGIGNVPGVVVTIVFALPPLVRLDQPGIRQVRPDLIEAALRLWRSPVNAGQGAAAAGHAFHHGGHQPVADAVVVHGGHRFP